MLALSVSGTALAAGVSQLFREQIPVASAIPLTRPRHLGQARWRVLLRMFEG